MLDDRAASFTLDGYSKDGIAERASLYVFPSITSGVIMKDTRGKRLFMPPQRLPQLELHPPVPAIIYGFFAPF